MSRLYITKYLTEKRDPLQRLYLAVALLLVVLVGTSMWTSTTLARYITATSGSDSARVAGFVVEAAAEEDQSESLTLDSTNKTASYAFTVSNANSDRVNEVTTAYDVTVTFPSALSGTALTLKNGEKSINGTTTDNTTYVFKDVGEFEPGEGSTDSLSLNFALNDGADTDGKWENIKIVVNATQQD